MTEKPARLRRVQLAVPGSSEKMLAKAAGSAADHVFCDLEDSVAPSAKAEAREKITAALNGLDWGSKTRCVRVNDVESPWCHDDIIHIVEGAHKNLDTIMLPKPLGASDVLFADRLLLQLEKKLQIRRRIGLEVLIEEVEGLQHVEEIALSCDRLEAMVFGMGDYSASQGMSLADIGGSEGYPGDVWHYARFRIVAAARAAGIDAVDGPYSDFSNEGGYREECRRALVLGCSGKWAIHPSQIAPALEVFTPSESEVLRARKMAAAYEEAKARGLGSVNVDGAMVDAATIRLLANVLRRADLIGM